MEQNRTYNHTSAEQEMQNLWQEQKSYAFDRTRGPVYSIDTPPPTVSGSLHIGHIFSYTQTDIIARYKRLSGHAVFYPFGFDDNGLPTERFVEKQRAIVAHQLKRSEFIAICLEETAAVEAQFKALWQAIGLSVDWNACYSTIDTMSRRISQQSFIKLYQAGFIYRRDEPALYCTTCRTSVAQAELDDLELPSNFYDIAFQPSPEAMAGQATENKELIIATTRPELLGSCVAILYHPDDARYEQLAHGKARVPIFNYEVPLIADRAVIPDKGTGLVMCCTFGDKTDVAWYKQYNLPYRPSIGRDGRFLETAGPLAGLKVTQAREKIVEALREAGSLRGQRSITHAVNVHERCKQPIEFLVLKQWFISLLPHKEKLRALADKIHWYPAFMKTRYDNWVEHIGWDWCISRQRFYGISFPVWHCECGEVILAKENQLPVDPQEVEAPAACHTCKSSKISPDTDVMDTWNTSSLTPYLCKALETGDSEKLFDEPYTPMGMRPQAHDIIRTWAFYTITKTWMHHKEIPWHDIVISGHVLSSEKEKISKSRDNSPLKPENLLKTYPADVIRYWTASGMLGHDVAFSESQLKIGNRLLVKLWNVCLFIAEHMQVPSEQKKDQLLNQWILHGATECFTQYQKAFEQYEFSAALSSVERWFWHDLCDNYIELVKDQFFKPELYDPATVAETRATLYDLGLRLLQLYAPFMPHVTEYIYQRMYAKDKGTTSLHITKYQDIQIARSNPESEQNAAILLKIIAEMRRLKSEQKLSLKTELAQLTLVVESATARMLASQEQVIKGASRAQSVIFQEHAQVELQLESRDGAWYMIIKV